MRCKHCAYGIVADDNYCAWRGAGGFPFGAKPKGLRLYIDPENPERTAGATLFINKGYGRFAPQLVSAPSWVSLDPPGPFQLGSHQEIQVRILVDPFQLGDVPFNEGENVMFALRPAPIQ